MGTRRGEEILTENKNAHIAVHVIECTWKANGTRIEYIVSHLEPLEARVI